MIRRLTSLGLVLALLCSPALRAGESAAMLKAGVEVGQAPPGQVRAVADAVRRSGADVRVVSIGKSFRLEIAAAAPAALARALAALKKAAGDAGLKIDFRWNIADSPAEGIVSQPGTAVDAQPTGKGHPASALPPESAGARDTRSLSLVLPAPDDGQGAWSPSALPVRGPPA